VGILMTLAPELSKALCVTGIVTGGEAIFWFYLGLTFGNIACGALSQAMRSRKKVLLLFLITSALLVAMYFLQSGASNTLFYAISLVLGLSSGYWALFVTIAAEQFGTNLRATVATTVPNFVRGSVVALTAGVTALTGSYGLTGAALIVGAVSFALALAASFGVAESYGRDLDFLED